VGDVIFGRHVQEILDAKGDPEHPFRPLAALYSEVDFTFANLENPFFSGAKPRGTPPGKTLPVLWAKPEHARTLARYRFFAVNLANNHAMDQGLAGLEETMTTLDAAGIRHVGAGRSLEEAWRPMIVDVRGLRIGFVGVSYTSQNDTSLRNEHVARIEDEDRLAAACKEAREREKAHFVVATMHAGVEHDHEPNAQQRVFARAAVRAGADIVIGAHPHVVQPAAKVEGTWVFYSLGNFVFDQPSLDNREAVAVELELVLPPGGARAKIERLRVHPVRIDEAAPRPAPEESAVRILRRLHVDSRDGVMPVE
jgi:poly-gamma-glutamate synthesis protein (capsule biosynthesis protein)